MIMKVQVNVTKEILIAARFCGRVDINGDYLPANPELIEVMRIQNKIPPVAKNCAIALAVRELFPKAEVGSCHLADDSTGLFVHLQSNVTAFIKQFDRASPVKRATSMDPFSFEIDVPNHVINKIGIDDAIKIIKRTPSLELVK
jgi:hypothetical protein